VDVNTNYPSQRRNIMKNKKVLTIAALAGLTLGGLTVTAASADGGGDSPAPTAETSGVVAADSGDIVLIQTEEPDAQDGEVEGERQGRRGHRGNCGLEEAAAAIGIDEADLRAALDNGDTIADVAEANGVDVDEVIAAMVDAKADRLDAKVAEGRITQEEADNKLADDEARITDRVNGVQDAPDA